MNFEEYEKSIADQPARVTCCVYGSPKSGKTLAIGRLAEAGFKLHWFDLENGWETLRQLSPEAKRNITLYKIPDTRGMPLAIETMMKVIRGTKITVCAEHGKSDLVGCPLCRKSGGTIHTLELGALGPADIVVIDSGSQLTESAISHTIKGQADDYKLQQDDWGNVGKLLGNIFSYVQAARFHVIVTAHELDPTGRDDKVQKKLVPSIGTKAFATNSGKYFGHLVYLETKNRKHVAASSTTASMQYSTGSRTNVALESSGAEYSLLDIYRDFAPNKGAQEVQASE